MSAIKRDIVSTVTFHWLFWYWFTYGLVVSQASEFGFRFEKWPSWEVVKGGDEMTFNCSTNLPPDSIRWQHNHRFLTDQTLLNSSSDVGPFRIVDNGPKGSSLIVKIFEDSQESKLQEGLYQCVASVGSISVTSLPGRLQLAFFNPFERNTPLVHSLRIEEESVFRVACERPESLPKATLRYYHDEHLLDLTDEKQYHVTDNGDLIILTATSASVGRYTCAAYNSFLQQTSEYHVQTQVSVKRKDIKDSAQSSPRLIAFDSVIKTELGKRVRFLCICKDCEGQLYWTLRGSGSRIATSSDNRTASLIIREVTVDDEGIYRCHGNNSFGYSFVDITLYVQTVPYVLKGPESKSVAEKSAISLECVFGGSPAPTVAWVFNGRLLTNSQSVRIFGNEMELSSVEKNQAGIYQCFGFNPLGSTQETAVVTVIPKTVTASSFSTDTNPTYGASKEREIDLLLESESEVERQVKKKRRKQKNEERKSKRKFNKMSPKRKMIAPSSPNITKLSDESVMVTWESEADEGMPILFFKVQFRVLEGPEKEVIGRGWKTIDEDIPPHVKSFEVTGLKTNHLYRFRVLAAYVNNDNQPGKSSKKFFLEKEIKLKNPENAPEILFLFPVDETSLTVFWDYRASTKTEGFIIYYRESTSAAEYTKVTLLGADRRNYTITHLVPKYPYDFKITSFNMAGTSEFSARKTFRPKGVNFTTEDVLEEAPSSSIVPIVISEPEMGFSDYLLYIALGSGLGLLLLTVIVSYTIYSCRKKSSGEESSESKFTDTSLRIHRLSSADIRKQNGFQSTSENEIPLLASKRSLKDNSGQNVKNAGLRVPVKENGNVKIMKETSFVGKDQPPNMYGESS